MQFTQVEYKRSDLFKLKIIKLLKRIQLFVGSIFQEISKNGVNIDMISQVMLEDEMRIDFTCDQKDQEKLNEAIENIKQKHPRIMVYQSRNVAKVMVEGEKMKDEIGVAAHIFEILGKYQVPLLQITTSEISISCVIPSEFMELAVNEIKKLINYKEDIMEPIFEGSAVALVLPMNDDGSLDFEGFKRQVQRMIDGGVQALLVNGTTGETPTITIEEEFELTKIVMEMAKGTGS